MSRQSNKPKKSRSRPGSLLAPEAMGGIAAGKGFDFQTRYAACYVPVWLLKKVFQHLLLRAPATSTRTTRKQEKSLGFIFR